MASMAVPGMGMGMGMGYMPPMSMMGFPQYAGGPGSVMGGTGNGGGGLPPTSEFGAYPSPASAAYPSPASVAAAARSRSRFASPGPGGAAGSPRG
ncbi:unnamed protein product [Tilletia controversa]|nr:unnamed protein product [Tilletia controversa]